LATIRPFPLFVPPLWMNVPRPLKPTLRVLISTVPPLSVYVPVPLAALPTRSVVAVLVPLLWT
jgi:hypothetical protein